MKLDFSKGQMITFFLINSFAMTTRKTVVFDRETETHIIYKISSRKRKLYQVPKDEIVLLFKGLDHPIGSDMDGSVMRGNACLNLVSDLSHNEVREYIDEHNLVDVTASEKAHMLLYTKEQAENSNYSANLSNCLYPLVTSTSAMVDSIRSIKNNEINA